MQALSEIFSDIVSPDAMLCGEEDRRFYGTDACVEYSGQAGIVLLPDSTERVAAIVKRCLERHLPIVPSGGRSGYSGGATALNQEVVVSTERLRQMGAIDLAARCVRCGAGVKTETLQKAATAAGLSYPVDFSSRGSSCIGGNIATNAGGIRVLRYGSTRDWVVGLTVVSGSAEILHLNGELTKNQTGLDLRGLMIGSEGVLGIITEAVMRLSDRAREGTRFLIGCELLENAIELLTGLRRVGWVVTLCEYFDQRALEIVRSQNQMRKPFSEQYPVNLVVEVENFGSREDLENLLAQYIEQELCQELVVAAGPAQAELLLSYRDGISDAIRKSGVPHKNDISVPIRRIPQFVADLRELIAQQDDQLDLCVFGHLGDGNLHLNILKPQAQPAAEFSARMRKLDSAIFALVERYDGSISAEHGVGILKRDYLKHSRSASQIAMMRQIKAIFDPAGIMNPGKVF